MLYNCLEEIEKDKQRDLLKWREDELEKAYSRIRSESERAIFDGTMTEAEAERYEEREQEKAETYILEKLEPDFLESLDEKYQPYIDELKAEKSRMKRISIDNGFHFLDDPTDALKKFDEALIANYMDDETRERVHYELAPCTPEEFLLRYLELAPDDLIIG